MRGAGGEGEWLIAPCMPVSGRRGEEWTALDLDVLDMCASEDEEYCCW